MKQYVSPKMEVICFNADDSIDTITNSDCDCVGEYSAVCDDCTIDN